MRRAGRLAWAATIGALLGAALLLGGARDAWAKRPPNTRGGFMGVDVGGQFFLDQAHKDGLSTQNVNFGLHFGYELDFGLAPWMRVEYAPLSVDCKTTACAVPNGSGHYGSVLFGARYIYRNYHKYWFWVAPWAGFDMGFSLFGLSGGFPDNDNPAFNFAVHVSWGLDFRITNSFWVGPQFRFGHMVPKTGVNANNYLSAISGTASSDPNNPSALQSFYVMFNAHLLF